MVRIFINKKISKKFYFVDHKCPCLTGGIFQNKVEPSSVIMNLMLVFGYKCGPSDMNKRYIVVFLLKAGQP